MTHELMAFALRVEAKLWMEGGLLMLRVEELLSSGGYCAAAL